MTNHRGRRFDRRLAVSGAQPPEVLRAAVERALQIRD
jgi:hypothetical protein